MNLSEITSRKFVESYSGNGRMISTPQGDVEILEVHKTIPYRKFKITLKNGLALECAYNHVVINANNDEIYAKDCFGEMLQTENGISEVISVIDLNVEENMYDVSLASKEEVYYSNGILSHNSGKSITVGVYLCWLALFEKDINIGIAAQSNSMASEFLTKVKDIFMGLPIWLTPGIKVWNVKSISLENGVRLMSDTASSNSFRGHTCLRGDTKIDIMEDNVEKTVMIKDLHKKNTNSKIKTLNGYKKFDGIKRVKEAGLSLFLENTTINCTKSHRICVGKSKAGKIFRKAENIRINNKIKKQKVTDIQNDSTHFYYDPINVEGDHTYLVDGVTHHNCTYLVTDEAAYIVGNDNGTTKFKAYLDAMLPSQSSLAKKKNIFISTANGMNDFYTMYKGALKDGKEIVEKILDANAVLYSDTVENHFKNTEIHSTSEIKEIKKIGDRYKVKYEERKIGSNGSIAFSTDWRKVPRWNQDGTPKTPEQFQDEVIASKGEVFFNQAYKNTFVGSSYTLINSDLLKTLEPKTPIEIVDGKLKIYHKYIPGNRYICSVDPAKDGVDGFVVNFVDITGLKFKQAATANLNIDYLLMPAYLDDWCRLYGNPYLIIENNEGAGQSVTDQMVRTYEYDNIHYDINKNAKNAIKGRKKYSGTRTTKSSRNQILKTMKTFFDNGHLEINDDDTIQQLFRFILIDGKYQADIGAHDDCVMSLALAFTLFNDIKNFNDMKIITDSIRSNLEQKDPVNVAELITIGSFDQAPEPIHPSNKVIFEGFDDFRDTEIDYNISEFGHTEFDD